MYEKELNCAIEAAETAGREIMKIYMASFEVSYKSDESPVTSADIGANHIILEKLQASFPKDGILSEESEDDESRFTQKRFWVVDPLDGTKEFIKKNGEFSINIGLVDGGEVVVGVIYIPDWDLLYYASKGKGAYKKSLKDNSIESIQVSKRLKPYRLLISRSHPSQKTQLFLAENAEMIASVTEMGSSIKGCLIADGTYDVYYNFGLSMKWDTCAMECIVSESGGILRKLNDAPIDYLEDNKLNRGFYIVNNWNNRVDLTKIFEM
ncbi:3'(2'),5'-bisphosphate nucleotidase CysQ [Fusibacter tunisiensis]|uniref:3'(2'),5'-bisphosphate nucleotidase CysQ n=1 Tax=Fusibacter tunisiensis TaxID=1008308 RepID=A0ABS2MSC3_9FIRM|nr:3'(2'),5'-bisphosphate nucleotidase CysQ [Fusibacter tunisiensis]MBM7562257.1 3'(2'), 5'-bisphosphate nucleotidase [Fusibacter tunisiensis]